MKLLYSIVVISYVVNSALGKPVDSKESSSLDDVREALAKKLFARNTFEDHTKEFILRAQKRFDFIAKQKTSNSIPTLTDVPRISSVISSSDLLGSRRYMSVGNRQAFDGTGNQKASSPQDSTLHEKERDEDEAEDSLQSNSRFKRQDNEAPVMTSSTTDSTPFNRVLDALSKQSSQLAEQYEKFKAMTENLAKGLKELQEKANISRDSLRDSAANLGSDLRTGLNDLVGRINSTVSGLTLADLQNGIKSVMSQSTPEYAVTQSSTAPSSDQLSIESVISELLTPGEASSTTPSSLEHVKQQFSQFIQGAENFLKSHRPNFGGNRDKETVEAQDGQQDRHSFLTRLSGFSSRRKTKDGSDAASSSVPSSPATGL